MAVKSKEIEPFYKALGARIRDERTKIGMSQRTLGEAIEPKPMTRAGIANIESGGQRVLTYTLTQIAAKLGVAVNQLLPEVRVGQQMYVSPSVRNELKNKLNLSPQKLRDITQSIERARNMDIV